MATYRLVTTGAEHVASQYDAMGERATQLRPIFDDLIDALIRGEKTLWDRNGGGGRNRWPGNTKRTIARKIAHGRDPRVMRDTGATEKALTIRHERGQIANGGGTTLTFGVKGVGANVAQFSKNPHRHREVLKVLPKTRKEVRQIILDHILEGLH